ncbi:RecQ family ATP-dependent DNA helicase [Mucilaginibacter terrae]|uniref:DNA 3'-5' helicase n=1 Tax=Mucilaginibacter terrae TaxID=1955052 RepID=A0ABU3GQP5_9SPHI|nr:RecQ family ATP-dependent DNA helicase [Mucilaginibacter terrae]MDT3401861.1 ATP-dependent DNA helicase RecQ [Mucilaginibacter terrae]
MNTITFIDTEVAEQTGRVYDYGGIKDKGNILHSASAHEFTSFISETQYICGHNILNHDVKFISGLLSQAGVQLENIIDTLYLSPLLFPAKPYHSLIKDDKLNYDEPNNPLNDAIKAKDLFYDEMAVFTQLPEDLKQIYYLLLKGQKEFSAFFRYLNYTVTIENIAIAIIKYFKNDVCNEANIEQLIAAHPVELAYCLALIKSENRSSITPRWVLINYPDVERLMFILRNKPCIAGCNYCNQALDAHLALKRFFGFDTYRQYAGEPLQLKAVEAAIHNQSFLAVFPTGGGKSITFQVPALMSGDRTRGLTVVISPLQSLMKDQVDNLEKVGITAAVTINGLLDPIERAKSFERVEDGSACMLYISPESLRSKSIERLLLGRKIARFVIDEAHCFSSWGQDFRVDYLYIGDFLKNIQEKKNLAEPIPISCFTATAKPKVIEDICVYFEEKLNLQLRRFTTSASRTNLHYKVLPKNDDDEKYATVRDLVTDYNCPAIIYVSRTKRAVTLADRLIADGLNARAYHGKMAANDKTANQNAFLSGEVQIMVATSAFGMGVDKKDVGVVIHHDISDSLENYVQEAGRAGRDEQIEADCYVLYNEEDLSKHFILLNQTRLSIKEIQQIWKAIKNITRLRATVSNSALEIARQAGWDDSVAEIETRVITAIAALEDAGYLKRGQNSPRVFANSILSPSAQDAITKINASALFTEKEKEKAIRIIKKLFSSKSRKRASEETAESRVDYISDHLGIVKDEVIRMINLMREESILADAKDLTAFIKQGDNIKNSLGIVEKFSKIERSLLPYFNDTAKTFNAKELNECLENEGCIGADTSKIKTLTNFWAIKNWIKKRNLPLSKYHFNACTIAPVSTIKDRMTKRHELAGFIVDYLYRKTENSKTDANAKNEVLVEFSVHELKEGYEQLGDGMFKRVTNIDEVEDSLFYLSRIEAIKIEGGFLVVYNRLTVERLEQDNKIRYKTEDYEKLKQYYESKIQQIHIVGAYAQKMLDDYREALQFVEDYFQLNYPSFLNRYFKGDRKKEIKLNITPTKFKQLFGELSPTQLNIIKNQDSKYIVVAAGPGSGKTKVLVHKLASLMLMEDVKHEQLLMLTFSRAAATEFKKRLLKLIGNSANYIEIKTFHSYCFDLLGKVGSLEKNDDILKSTTEKIRSKDIDLNRITKTVLVIDEAQDMSLDEFNLVSTLIAENEDMRVIAVGDDDQNIYEFRGADSKYLQQLADVNEAKKYELVDNYRSKSNLVDFANQFAITITNRLKSTPIVANKTDNGNIKIESYKHGNLIMPLVNDILNSPLKGTTCVLTQTNDEALQITGLLLKNGMQAKLIQSNDSFNLYNLAEIRHFVKMLNAHGDVAVLTEDAWENAKRQFGIQFKTSRNLAVCQKLLKDFEITHGKKKYKSDLDVFISESKLEDFYTGNGETIFVSTIHKAKGKEFNNVFLLLENLSVQTNELNRRIYVAITRAKQNLCIHTNSNYFDNISTHNLAFTKHSEPNPLPSQMAMHLTHKDVWLDYFNNTQTYLSNLTAGSNLIISGDECLTTDRKPVLKFSTEFLNRLKNFESKGYKPVNAVVNFVLHWQAENAQHEIKIVLPELYLQKM